MNYKILSAFAFTMPLWVMTPAFFAGVLFVDVKTRPITMILLFLSAISALHMAVHYWPSVKRQFK